MIVYLRSFKSLPAIPAGRFLGMDVDYDLSAGILKMHMATYIASTVQRFADFDLSKGIPYRELVG